MLHNVMPIFTFMGANMLRQDSLYSFQIITKTIDTVIPPLIKVRSGHKCTKTVDTVIPPLIRVRRKGGGQICTKTIILTL